MGQLLLYGLLAIVLAGGLFVLAARFLPAGEQIAPALRDEAPWDLPPDRPLHPDEVDAVRLPVALRGYRFAETDILLDRLAGEIRARDLEIARLRGQRHPAPFPPAPLSFAKPVPDAQGDASPDVPGDVSADADAERVEPPPGTWAPEAPEAPEAPPQAPPSDDDEQPVTAAPADHDRP